MQYNAGVVQNLVSSVNLKMTTSMHVRIAISITVM